MGIHKISTVGMSHEEWLEHRRRSVGGSDAAAIVGLNGWASPYSVWAEKTGRLPPKEDNEAMRQGRDLEAYVASRWEEATGKHVRRCNAILTNSAYPFAHANIDRDVVGENAGLECKTTSILWLREFKGGEYPAAYYAQCVHYMAVTGAERWYLGVLVLNQGFYCFVIERDQAEIDALMAAEAAFWHYVQEDTPPPVDGSEATSDALETIYAEGRGGTVDLFGLDGEMKALLEAKREMKSLKEQVALHENVIKERLGDAEEGRCGGFRAAWKNQTRRTFDARRFSQEHPELDLDGYYNTSTFRTFTVKEQEQ